MAYDMRYSMDDSVGLSLMEVKNVESPGVSDPLEEAMVPIEVKSINPQQYIGPVRFGLNKDD